jgi:hypothetical protein
MSKTVFILGAGATRGCSFVGDLKRQGRCLPPLDGDFFTQLQRVSNQTHRPRIEELIDSLAQWFGHNYGLGMEQVFCHLEHAERMATHLQKVHGREFKSLTSLKLNLKQSIAIILGESLTRMKSGGHGSYDLLKCDWHDQLVERLSERGDAFITFNYDCVLDDSLRRMGGAKWNPKYGYRFKLGPKGRGMSGEQYWTPSVTKLATNSQTIEVHKIHGSLHFQKFTETNVSLKQRPYGNPNAGDMRFEIIPPESSKTYNDGRFGVIMENAYKSLRTATRVVVIGYSLPPSDQHAEALLRFGVKQHSLESLVVVNPDREARKRVRTALLRGMQPKTRVLTFDSLEEFANADPCIWKL